MKPLSISSSNDELLRFIDGWAALLEREDYAAAFAYTGHLEGMDWSPELIRAAIKEYGAARADQKVTVEGVPSDITQRKEVDRADERRNGRIGGIWYDLNIDGVASDLTATFDLVREKDGLRILLNDIHVM